MLVAPVGYPHGYSINNFFVLALGNYFRTWEGYLVEVTLDTLPGYMIVTGGVSLVLLSLGLTPVSPL